MKLKDLIVKVTINNTDLNGQLSSSMNISDYVYIDAMQELVSREFNGYTDYALINGKQPEATLLRSCAKARQFSNPAPCILKDQGIHIIDNLEDKYGIRPIINLNAELVSRAIQEDKLDFLVTTTKINGVKHHYVDFGEYPKNWIGNNSSERFIEENIDLKNSMITGKKYYQYLHFGTKKAVNFADEYISNGKKFVLAFVDWSVPYSKINNLPASADQIGHTEIGKSYYLTVEPIKWEIENWDELPTNINPSGTGSAKTIKLKSAETILAGFPFTNDVKQDYNKLYQNSIVRAFLNGYDLKKEILDNHNGVEIENAVYPDFSGIGFLDTAFDQDVEINTKTNKSQNNSDENSNNETNKKVVRKSRLARLNPDKTPESLIRNMSDTELIKSWIDNGESVLLRGPSGIGKTERLKSLYPDLIYIKLTNNMFPEKVVGSMNLQTGAAIPPDYVKHALLAEATEEEKNLVNENIQNLFDISNEIYERSKNSDKKVVILLDELLNVKPAVQSLVYTLVLNKFVELGKGLKLPANTVIVATGNQKKYSIVAEDLAEPLEKRFDHILDMEPKVGEWLSEYAIPNNLHPAVVGYIFSKYLQNKKSEGLDNIGYFYEEPEVGENHLDKYGCKGKTNDPRGWTSISNSLYNFENNLKAGKYEGKNVVNILKTTLYSKLRSEWAESFFRFYDNPVLTPEDIVDNNYTPRDYPISINEKFAQLAGLLTATDQQVTECRKFIREHCDPEYLSVYDIYWAGNDETRIQKIAELQEMELMDDVLDTSAQ